ncbi:MAG: C2H2-type zinc finger protein [Chloroflexi bacterium]|nr:MAG: C2H2-type zinc finger protein [Chloroflexota bacterium]
MKTMDDLDAPRKPDTAGEDQALAGAGGVTSGLECPTCGDRFPSKETLEEHLPTHKQL